MTLPSRASDGELVLVRVDVHGQKEASCAGRSRARVEGQGQCHRPPIFLLTFEKNGLCSSSWPRVVSGPWPQASTVSRGQGKNFFASCCRNWSAKWVALPPIERGEEGIAHDGEGPAEPGDINRWSCRGNVPR